MELFSLQLNWDDASMLFLAKKSENLTFKIFLNTFKKIGSREIGWNSSRDFGEEAFGIGITLANLKSCGKISCWMHLLNREARYGDRIGFANFINIGDMPSTSGGRMRFDVINRIADILRRNFIHDKRLHARFAVNFEISRIG